MLDEEVLEGRALRHLAIDSAVTASISVGDRCTQRSGADEVLQLGSMEKDSSGTETLRERITGLEEKNPDLSWRRQVGIAPPLCSHNTIFQGVQISEESRFYPLRRGRGQGWLQLLCARGLGDLEQNLHGCCCRAMSPPSLATPQKILSLML